MSSLTKFKAALVLVVLATFFVFMLMLLVNSFPADYRIANNDLGSYFSTGSLMPLFHLASELTGEVGVILRFAGTCFFLAFAYTLLRKNTISWSFLKKAVLLEGIYYLFNIPFITYLITRAVTSSSASSAAILTYYGAAISYAAQILFVTPVFLMLYRKLSRSNIDRPEVAKWVAFAIVGFIFGLWIKHFMLAIYAIGIDFSSTAYMIGSLNSILTLLLAGIIAAIAFIPLFKKKGVHNPKLLGVAFVITGLYATIYLAIAAINEQYMNWASLIDYWTIIFVVLGIGLLIQRRR